MAEGMLTTNKDGQVSLTHAAEITGSRLLEKGSGGMKPTLLVHRLRCISKTARVSWLGIPQPWQ
jgi:hypothetical protein